MKDGCDDGPGRLEPHIDRHRCEGDRECVKVCPFDVFEVRRLTVPERRQLPRGVRFRLWVYGNRQAFTTHADACHACSLCVTACPEHAIQLAPITIARQS